MPHRLFAAIRPPDAVCDLLLDAMEGIEGARWQDAENLHITLRFVGEVDTPLANDLAAELARIAAPPLRLSIAGVGHFEHKGRPHAIWARIAPDAALDGLRKKVERPCVQAGLPPETRRFTPHITLARLNRSSGDIGAWLARWGNLRTDPWDVQGFGLWESHLTPAGSHYEERLRYRLAD